MRFIMALTLLLTSTLVSSIPTLKRDAIAVLSDVSKLSGDVSNLTIIVSSYTGAYNENEPFIAGFEGLKTDIECLTSNVVLSGSFDLADASAISNTLQDLTHLVVNLLVDLMQKASVIASAGAGVSYTSLVHASLVTLNGDFINFFNILEGLIPLEIFGGISVSQEQIAAVFADAISTFA